MFGNQVGPGYMGRPRDIIGSVETSPAGNVILRCGSIDESLGITWEQSLHIVLTPDETRALAESLVAAIPMAAPLRSWPRGEV